MKVNLKKYPKDKPPYYGRPPYAAVCLLESGGIRGNMLTRRFALVPPLYRTNGEKL